MKIKIIVCLFFWVIGFCLIAQTNQTKVNLPQVYWVKDISSEGLMKAYQALNTVPQGKVAVKLHSGEPGNTHYLKPELIKPFVQAVQGTIVEANTGYGGPRSTTREHYQVIEEHGFLEVAQVVILDEMEDLILPVTNGKHLQHNRIGGRFDEFDSHIVLSHFKGHQSGGYGGALKNMAIGYASSKGKINIHSAGKNEEKWTSPEKQEDFLESMAEAVKSIIDHVNTPILYLNVMNNLSVDCDCNGNPASPKVADIGILSSLDPVALDQACLDLIYQAPNNADLIERIESRNGQHTIIYAEQLGIGSREYQLVEIE